MAIVAGVAFGIQFIIFIIFFLSWLASSDIALSSLTSPLGDIANNSLYFVFPSVLMGLVCVVWGGIRFLKTREKYSGIAFLLGVPSIFWFLLIAGYVFIFSLAFTAG